MRKYLLGKEFSRAEVGVLIPGLFFVQHFNTWWSVAIVILAFILALVLAVVYQELNKTS
jgi:hypothetical protein